MTRPAITVYSRPGCHLCEMLIEELLPLVRDLAKVKVTNIDDDKALAEAYGLRVPVVEIDGREVCHFHLDRDAILKSLKA